MRAQKAKRLAALIKKKNEAKRLAALKKKRVEEIRARKWAAREKRDAQNQDYPEDIEDNSPINAGQIDWDAIDNDSFWDGEETF